MLATDLNCYKILYWPMTLGQKWLTRPIVESSAVH